MTVMRTAMTAALAFHVHSKMREPCASSIHAFIVTVGPDVPGVSVSRAAYC